MEPTALGVGDFNGDGKPDLALGDPRGFFGVLMNDLPINPVPLSAAAVNFGAVAGAPFSGTVATFTNPNTFDGAASYTATIDWGDGTTSDGTITGTGTLSVSGWHTYADQNIDAVSVQISNSSETQTTATVYPTATVTSLGQAVQARTDRRHRLLAW